MKTVLNLTPLDDWARRAGARFVDRHGWRIAETYTAVETELAAARTGCGLGDDTPNGRVLVEGRPAPELLTQGVGAPALAVGTGAAIEGARLYRLRPDLFFLGTPPAGERPLIDRLRAARGDRLVTITDITPGRAELVLVGPAGAAVLSKLCGLDAGGLPDGAVRQTGVAKTGQLIARRDRGELPAFTLVGARSLGAYLWSALLEAGREWDIVPVGQAALRALENGAGFP